MKKIALLISLPLIFGCTKAQEKKLQDLPNTADATNKKYNCTSKPCGNTATGDDPLDVGIKEGSAIVDEIRSADDDKARWASVILYSDSKKAKDLEILLIKKNSFAMKLNPQSGHIIFAQPEMEHVFEIASPRGEKGDVCPGYNIKVTQATSAHAIIRKICREFEYQTGKYYMSNEFFLYDSETATVRNIWRSAVHSNGKFPEADPTPMVKKVKNGYRFDWVGLFTGDNKPIKMEIHNVYFRKKDAKGNTIFLCTDITAPKGEGLENEMCAGNALPKISPR